MNQKQKDELYELFSKYDDRVGYDEIEDAILEAKLAFGGRLIKYFEYDGLTDEEERLKIKEVKRIIGV